MNDKPQDPRPHWVPYFDDEAQLTKRLADAEARVAAVEALLGPGDHARWGGEPDGYLVPMSAILAALETRTADRSESQ